MPFYWTRIQQTSTPGGGSSEGDLAAGRREKFFDDQDRWWMLLEVSEDPRQQEQAREAVGAVEWYGIVSETEHRQGKRPPASGHKPKPS